MDEIPFYRKPWFNSIVLTIILLGIYIYNMVWQGGLLGKYPGDCLRSCFGASALPGLHFLLRSIHSSDQHPG